MIFFGKYFLTKSEKKYQIDIDNDYFNIKD